MDVKLRIDGEGRSRVVVEAVRPEVEAGAFPIKRTVGERVKVSADIFADGHDAITAVLRYRRAESKSWEESLLKPDVNDVWKGAFAVNEVGEYRYTVTAWIDTFATWLRDYQKRVAAGQPSLVDLQIGAELIADVIPRCTSTKDRSRLQAWVERLGTDHQYLMAGPVWEDVQLLKTMQDYSERRFAATYVRELSVIVDRERARFSAWYEMFPRSCSPESGRHGTLADCAARLPYVAEMGFDVLYLPPIHPIGKTFRKGPNNEPEAGPDNPGSPWAIGSKEGGHKAIHPELGTLEDFRSLVKQAADYGIDVALDIAFQCSPDHPYVREHRNWFRARPDGTIQYAENPPKKYQDIYPFDFETEDWPALWTELRSVFEFWIKQGVNIFRVDNPHTKSFPFWRWVIGELKRAHPDVLFLSEAFTRPKVMYRLAKVGFCQSYNYFPWRNTKQELIEYFTELTQTNVGEFFRPNLWPNTPDILTEYLQVGGRPAFITRFVLAATLGASYGIYGPAFELCHNQPRLPGSEEYLDSEKYQVRHHDLNDPASLRELIAKVNAIRRENPALQSDRELRFHTTDNEEILCYSKQSDDGSNVIVVTVNLDPHHIQSGWVELPLEELGIDPQHSYQMHDLLTGARYLWHGSRNYVELSPHAAPAHVLRVRKRVRLETDFEYYL